MQEKYCKSSLVPLRLRIQHCGVVTKISTLAKKKKKNATSNCIDALASPHYGFVLLLPVSAVQFGFLSLWFNIWGWNTNPRDLQMKNQKNSQSSYRCTVNIDADVLIKPGPYHGLNQRHADLLMLYVGVVQADGDLHLVKYGKGVLLHLQSWTLDAQNRDAFQHKLTGLQCETRLVLYLFVKNEVCSSFILFVEEDSALKAELWDEHDDGVLSHKQDVSFFV